jgi:peptide methionine sulfoxide reductase msrA/msrB
LLKYRKKEGAMIYKQASLPPAILAITRDKSTEAPFTGTYDNFTGSGTYLCRQCGIALYRSETKFHSGCGWPSFDNEIAGHIKRLPDSDGRRTEILCEQCDAHLGHVFTGENFTAKNIRHCVNSLSLEFVADKTIVTTAEAIFAAGCFWGVEYYFKKLPGVIKTEVGYIGGTLDNPHYEAICAGNTGHVEAIRVLYDPKKVSFEDVAKYFFEIHDPTDKTGQGPDKGPQYLSQIFYYTETQKNIALHLIEQLRGENLSVVTAVVPVSVFWPAEAYHQDYYAKTEKEPYCHRYTKRL